MSKPVAKRVFKFTKDKKFTRERQERIPTDESLNSVNSFLVEVDYNSDINPSIRKDIEKRYKRSLINAEYIFPRLSATEYEILPQVKHNRRNLSENGTNLNKTNPKKNVKKDGRKPLQPSHGKSKTLCKRLGGAENKPSYYSATPTPFIGSLKRKELTESRRETPSPTPRIKFRFYKEIPEKLM